MNNPAVVEEYRAKALQRAHQHYRWEAVVQQHALLYQHVLDGTTPVQRHQVEAILNLAAESHVDRSIMGPGVFVETNVSGTQVLLDAAHRAKVKRFVQVSTDEVYGSLGVEGHFSETSALKPSSPYSASKAAADLLALAYHRTFGLDVVVTRCSNNYGQHQFPEKLIPLMIANALEGKKLPVYGDGLHVRDWIHVEDHCSALVAALERGKPGEVYNVGCDNEWPNLQIVRQLLRILEKPESLIEYVKDRPGHDRRYAINARKARDEPKRTTGGQVNGPHEPVGIPHLTTSRSHARSGSRSSGRLSA